MIDYEYEHIFGWMRKNPTWAKEIAAVDQLRAENQRFKEAQIARDAEDELAIKALKAQVETLRAEVAEAKAAFNKLNEMLAESLEDRDRLRELLREAYSASVCKVEGCEECEEIAKKIDAALGGEGR